MRCTQTIQADTPEQPSKRVLLIKIGGWKGQRKEVRRLIFPKSSFGLMSLSSNQHLRPRFLTERRLGLGFNPSNASDDDLTVMGALQSVDFLDVLVCASARSANESRSKHRYFYFLPVVRYLRHVELSVPQSLLT